MITRCRSCREHIRDCTGFTAARVISVSWYHMATGREHCADGLALASPAPSVSVLCGHHDQPRYGCLACVTASQVSLYFHNLNRCIPRLCGWMHVHSVPVGY